MSNKRAMQMEKARRILRMKQYLSSQEARKKYQSTMAAMPAAEATKFMEQIIKNAHSHMRETKVKSLEGQEIS